MMICTGRSFKDRKVLIKGEVQAVCIVLDTFGDKRVVPRWSQCCSILSIRHESTKRTNRLHIKVLYQVASIKLNRAEKRKGGEIHIY